MTEIRRITSKTHIPDSEAFCQDLLGLVSDDDFLGANKIALIAKDEVIVKVLVDKLLELGLKPKQIRGVLEIHSLQPLATRLIQKMNFHVENQLPNGDEILPIMLEKPGQFDIIIGNPPIKSKENDRNNTWVDKIVDALIGQKSPLTENGVVAISLPVKQGTVEKLKQLQVIKIMTGMEKHFPGTPARHNYYLKNTKPSEDPKLEILTHEKISSTIKLTDIEYFGKTADIELSALLSKIKTYSKLFVPKRSTGVHSETDKEKTSDDGLLYVRNGLPKQKGRSQLLCCVDVDDTKKHEDCTQLTFAFDKTKHVKVWDWGRTAENGHHACRVVNKGQASDDRLKGAGLGVEKVVWKNKSVSPWSPNTTALKYDPNGEYITNENSIFYPVKDKDEADRIVAYLTSNFFQKLITPEFKTDKYWTPEICEIPDISPMTDENLAHEFDLSPKLRAMIGL